MNTCACTDTTCSVHLGSVCSNEASFSIGKSQFCVMCIDPALWEAMKESAA